MENIINGKKLSEHSVEPYSFKVIGGVNVISPDDEVEKKAEKENFNEDSLEASKNIKKEQEHNKFIEDLLKKSDDLSSNIIKLQMQIEKQEGDFENRLQNEIVREKESSFNEGYQKCKIDMEQSIIDIKQKYLDSIKLLDDLSHKNSDFLKKIEEELSSTAVEIAKEVIAKELQHSSSDVCKALSKKLIKELSDAKKIELKVNPKDFDALKEMYAETLDITINSDSAIIEGGVVVLSDTGNLDGSISTRIDKVKNLVNNNQRDLT